MRVALSFLCAGALLAQTDWRETEINGRTIRYQVVDGQAIWQGDIVLGPVDAQGKPSSERASSIITGQNRRWPDNIVPYTIASDVPDKPRIEAAAKAWNDATPFQVVSRTSEPNYIEFRRTTAASCSSSVGMIGGRQFINLPDNCPIASIIHEIGHAIGFFHTQSREDRNMFIRVRADSIDKASISNYDQNISNADDEGPYAYDSIMHYSNTGFAFTGELAMETVPTGIPIGQRNGLSPSDIDTAFRLAGQQPNLTVITSNPAGLSVLVDGRAVSTPTSFDWAPGSTHTVSIADQGQYRFGRWSDFGERSHTLTASPATTVFTAHMRRFVPIQIGASPAPAGSVVTNPPVENGQTPFGAALELTPVAEPGFQYSNWSGVVYTTHGSRVPTNIAVTNTNLNYTANFTSAPLTLITSNPPGLRVVVDGTAITTPRRYAWAAGTRHEIAVETLTQNARAETVRNVFTAWSDGGDLRHTITAGAEPAEFVAEFQTSYKVTSSASPNAGGRVVIDPPPTESFLPAGTPISVVATPSPGYELTGWQGSLSGNAVRRELVVDGELDLRAQFVQTMILSAARTVHGATFVSGAIAPGEIVTLFGAGIGPEELTGASLTPQRRIDTISGGVRVLFDGTPGPMIYASARQVAAVAPFNLAGKARVLVQVSYQGRLTNSIAMSVAPAAPGFFTANSSGLGGGAFLNADGSFNSPANPAARGSIVVLYATGLGVMQPPMADGELAAAPFPRPAADVQVRIADRPVEIAFAGAAPGFVAGLIQLNVRVPGDIAAGEVPVVIEAAGARSPRTVSLAVR
jgi:astacin